MNPLLAGIILCSGGIVVCVKMFADSFKGSESNFKYDTVTDLRLRRKLFDDKTYKNNNTFRSNGTKGI